MKDNERNNGFRREKKQADTPKEISPVAELLLDIIKSQIQDFLVLDPEERFEGSKELFYVGAYPSELESDVVEGVSKYAVYQLERTVRLRKDDPERLNRMSTAILLSDKETGAPAFYLTAYITPKLVANIRVVPFNERGPMYKNMITYDNRDEQQGAAE